MASIFRKHEDGYEALPAVIVADKTDKLGKRLAMLAFGMLILFFVVNSYIQSSKNGELLAHADKQRTQLVTSLDRQSRTLDEQTKLIIRLQQAIREQNQTLRDAGLPVAPVPGIDDMPDGTPLAKPTPAPRTTRSSSMPRTTSRPRSSPSPRPKPGTSPKPSPSPTPLGGPVGQAVCDATGICLPPR